MIDFLVVEEVIEDLKILMQIDRILMQIDHMVHIEEVIHLEIGQENMAAETVLFPIEEQIEIVKVILGIKEREEDIDKKRKEI